MHTRTHSQAVFRNLSRHLSSSFFLPSSSSFGMLDESRYYFEVYALLRNYFVYSFIAKRSNVTLSGTVSGYVSVTSILDVMYIRADT